MSRLQYTLVVGLILIAFGLPQIWPALFSDSLDLTSRSAAKTGNLLTQIIFFALLIERATEVYVSSAFGTKQKALQSQDWAERKKLAHLERLLNESLHASDTVTRKTLIDEVLKAQKTLKTKQVDMDIDPQWTKLKQKVETHTTVFALGLSLLISLVGVRVFDGLTENANSLSNLVSGTDVIITGLMMAGGAKGLHPIMNMVKSLPQPKT